MSLISHVDSILLCRELVDHRNLEETSGSENYRKRKTSRDEGAR